MQEPYFSTVFIAIVAAIVIQGIKSIFDLHDREAKIVAICVGAVFFALNGVLAVLVTDPGQQASLRTLIGAILAILTIFAPPGVYSTVKAIGNRIRPQTS